MRGDVMQATVLGGPSPMLVAVHQRFVCRQQPIKCSTAGDTSEKEVCPGARHQELPLPKPIVQVTLQALGYQRTRDPELPGEALAVHSQRLRMMFWDIESLEMTSRVPSAMCSRQAARLQCEIHSLKSWKIHNGWSQA